MRRLTFVLRAVGLLSYGSRCLSITAVVSVLMGRREARRWRQPGRIAKEESPEALRHGRLTAGGDFSLEGFGAAEYEAPMEPVVVSLNAGLRLEA